MRSIVIEVNGDADVTVDGVLLSAMAPVGVVLSGEPIDVEDDSLRHDTPREVAIAAAAHEAHRQYCRLIGDLVPDAWSKAPGLDRALAIALVRDVETGQITTPQQAHDRWMAARQDTGWTYGPEFNYTRKTDPKLVAYAELAPAQRKKDRLFFAVVSALLVAE